MKYLDEKDILLAKHLYTSPESKLDDLVELTNIPKTTIHERIIKLKEMGIHLGQEINIDHKKIGFHYAFLFSIKFVARYDIEAIKEFVLLWKNIENICVLNDKETDLMFVKYFQKPEEIFKFTKQLEAHKDIVAFSQKNFVQHLKNRQMDF